MRIPMGTVTRDYLRVHRLASTQCASNMFRILGSVNALNEKMGLNLTHYDVNWVYNLHHLKGQGYYLKTRYLEVRLISCLPDSNKGMNKDFLIVLGEWHNGLPYPMREGNPSRALCLGLLLESHFFYLDMFCTRLPMFILTIGFFPLIYAIFCWQCFLFFEWFCR